MAYRLRDDLFYSAVQDRVVLLDLRRDRYFCLPAALSAPFQAVAEGAARPQDEARVEGLVRGGLLVASDAPAPAPPPPPPTPTRSLIAERDHRPPVLAAAEALLRQYAAWRRLRHQGLLAAIAHLRRLKAQTAPTPQDRTDPSPAGLAPWVEAFAHTDIVFSPHDRCLVRALGLATTLHTRGLVADLCIGVKLPFAAHAWLQSGAMVIGDPWEEVACFTPILVI